MQKKREGESDWLSIRGASRYLGVSEPTLRRWTDEGRLTVFRTPGGHRRYRLQELTRFQESLEEKVRD